MLHTITFLIMKFGKIPQTRCERNYSVEKCLSIILLDPLFVEFSLRSSQSNNSWTAMAYCSATSFLVTLLFIIHLS